MFKKLDKKGKTYVILAITFVLLLLGGTYAWIEWGSTINALVKGNVCAPEIVVLGGATINGSNLRPIVNKENGLHKDVEAKLPNVCADGEMATMDLYLNLELFPSALAEETLVWELYKVETNNNEEVLTLINDGNFDGQVQYVQNSNNGIINLTEGHTQTITSTPSTYRLYIYIDSSQDNPSTMQNQHFIFKLYGEGQTAIYKEHQIDGNITSSNNQTYFLLDDTNLVKDKIQSINIIEMDDIPENAIYIDDINDSNSNEIKLYYELDTDTNLNNIYLATSNGIVKANTNMDYMFAGLKYVESLDLTHLDTSDVTSMIGCFYNSTGLTTLDVSTWDTSKVMYTVGGGRGMFIGCSSLEELDLSNFNTSQMKSMQSMFSGCSSLTSLNISSFDTSGVKSMYEMFYNCHNLKTLDLGNFNTLQVENMQSMFSECRKLENLNLSSFNTSNVGSMVSMFYNCQNLKQLDLSGFNTQNVTDMSKMFRGCVSIEELDLSSFDTSNVTVSDGLGQMFMNCNSLKKVNLNSFDTKNVKNMSNMFGGCHSLEELDLSSFDTSNVTTMSYMFDSCESLTNLDLSNFNTSKVTNMDGMFNGCSELENLNISNFTSEMTPTISKMFSNDLKLEKLDLRNFNVSSITNNITFNRVPTTAEIIVNNCTDFNNKFSSYNFTNVHLADNTSCSV